MTQPQPLFSIWTQPLPYHIVLEMAAAQAPDGFSPIPGSKFVASGPTRDWPVLMRNVLAALDNRRGGGRHILSAVIAGDSLPEPGEILPLLRPASELATIMEHLWLVHDINANRLSTYLQRVVDRRDKLVGYEAFARIESADGGVIGGGAIMKAASVLKVEFQLDRVLHRHAVESYIASDLDGYLFINFLTGFIQRPEVYLEGLSHAVSRSEIRARAVVLDIPFADYARDLAKLRSIADYCASRGFALALDGITGPSALPKMLTEIRPAFIKLERGIGETLSERKRDAKLKEIVRIAHENGASVLAEGIETEAVHAQFLAAGVDLFQGYLFGAPQRIAALAQRRVNEA